ncbi:MAG: UPF0236 family transposase-like protein, partial [Bacillota bacterium]
LKREVKVLHVDADEDHVPLQDGSNTIVPIVTIHEGTKSLCKGRSRCINPHHISRYGKAPEELWLEVAEWIYEAYDVDKGVEHLKAKVEVTSLVKKAMKRAQKVFNGINLEALDNISVLSTGKVTPLFKKLQSIQHSGQIIR